MMEGKKLAIGVDIGGTRTKFGLVDMEAGKVLDMVISKTETKNEGYFNETVSDAVEIFKASALKYGSTITGIGFGIPGFVLPGGLVDSTYGFLEFMEDYPLQRLVEERYRLPCRMDNDARVVALGEALYGMGRNYDRVLVLTLGTGLGVGFAVKGKLYESSPYAHMAGHISIADNETKCYCGKVGCLEAMVSATALCKSAREKNWGGVHKNSLLSAESIFNERKKGDVLSGFLVDSLISHLRTGIDNYINIYAPDVIVLGGGVAKGLAGDLHNLHDPDLLFPYKRYQAVLKVSKLQEEAGILGSAALFN